MGQVFKHLSLIKNKVISPCYFPVSGVTGIIILHAISSKSCAISFTQIKKIHCKPQLSFGTVISI